MIKNLDNILSDIKIKKNDLIFFSFMASYVGFLVIFKAGLVGSLSLIFIALITFYISTHKKNNI